MEPQHQAALASSPDLATIETPVRSPYLDHEGWLRWTYDTGAMISAFRLDARIGKTASGELNERLSTGMEKVHSKGHVAFVDWNGGYIIPYISTLARKIQQLVQREIVKEPGAIRLF